MITAEAPAGQSASEARRPVVHFVGPMPCGHLFGLRRSAVSILDVKTPGSGEHERNVWKNLERLRAHDEVKFVITSADDYAFAKRIVDEHALTAKCTVLFSPSFPGLAPVTLAEWMVRDRLDVRFQMQLHKVLWGEKRGV